jgi:hypothetical protein
MRHGYIDGSGLVARPSGSMSIVRHLSIVGNSGGQRWIKGISPGLNNNIKTEVISTNRFKGLLSSLKG